MEHPIDKDLLRKFVKNQCNEEELAQIRLLMSTPGYEEALNKLLGEEWDKFTPDEEPTDEERSDWYNTFEARKNTDRRLRFFPTVKQKYLGWLAYAAAACLLTFVSIKIISIGTTSNPQTMARAKQGDILPGSEKALLTLSDGRTISLSDAADGVLIEQEGVDVRKTADGEIVYSSREGNALAAAYNSIITPKGGQYRITLPDGSKAWLNAASSLIYPVQFPDAERRVKMTGEVYFEIAKMTNDKKERIPFFVETDKQEIQVLGTQFNVNAYENEPYLKTALVEGSVRVTSMSNGQTVLLKPGQQALLSDVLFVKSADIDQQVGWQRGDFVFKGETLESVLRQISRWYDVETECPPHLAKLRFAGIVSRSRPLSSIIKIMESTNDINITINERRLTVTD